MKRAPRRAPRRGPARPPLGRRVAAGDRYDPGLLFAVPRAAGRRAIGIRGEPPFAGVDIWNAYEISWLDPRGRPRVAIGTFVFPAHSPRLVESKSMKLYLNSLNQNRFASDGDLRETIARDLEAASGGHVTVRIVLPGDFARLRIAPLAGASIDDLEIAVAARKGGPDPRRLAAGGETVEETLTSDLFRSLCPVTGQPDWASVQIHYRGPRLDREGLLRYLVSFRKHRGFHEHCVERIFMDLLTRCGPERLTVQARYTRRGGLDINPFRTNCGDSPVNRRTPRQ